MEIGEIRCKGILGRSGIGGMDYAVNPYLGCGHACAYCYARFMRRMGHPGEEWGSFVDAKVNAVKRLREEAARKPRGRVLLSSGTDAYQPVERKYRLTRGCLEVLLEHGYRVDVLTKNVLVLRDVDLFRKFDEVEVGFTVTSLDDSVRRAFEPGASPIKARLDALKTLSDEGIPTYAFLGPMLPYLSDEGLEGLLNVLADRVGRIIVDRLNIKCGNMPDVRRVLAAGYPDLGPMFEDALAPDSDYYRGLRSRVSEMCGERAIPVDIVY
ncbi:MAG: radical SAM protein [Candidatus Bathyarchaeota archaeon]|nr:radical SAM protein [Candidatus Bathyarchaeota archaeon]